MRIRGFTQDDSHIFCTPEQLADELASLLDFVLSAAARRSASTTSRRAVDHGPEQVRRHRRGVGRGHRGAARTRSRPTGLAVRGRRGRRPRSTARRSTSTCATRSAGAGSCRRSRSTSSMPERFDLEYVGADNERHRPIMIHRALFGSVERFFGVLLEHYAGAFPTWLAPVQVRVLPVRDDHEALRRRGRRPAAGATGFRVDVVDADEPLGQPHPQGQAREAAVRARRRRRRRRRTARSASTRAAARSSAACPSTTSWIGSRAEVASPICRDARPAVGRLAVGDVRRRTSLTMTGRGSVFTRILAAGLPDDGDPHRSGEGRRRFAILNAFPYGSGHLLVLPYREVAELEELDDDEASRAVVDRPRRRRRDQGRLRPGRRQRRHQPRPGRGRGRARPPPRPLPAPLERRHQLHDRGRRDARPARDPRRELAQAHRGLADPATPTPSELSCKVRHI